MHNAAILTTGTELVQGEILNTNAHSIATLLDDYYMQVRYHLTCADNLDDLVTSLRFLANDPRCDLIIIIGGLGPTNDDLTREAVSTFCKVPLIRNEEAHLKLTKIAQEKRLELNDNQKKQAYMPEHATRIENPRGTADAWLLSHEDIKILALPGPPHECIPLCKKFLSAQLSRMEENVSKSLYRVLHVPESELSVLLQEALADDESHIRYRAHYPYIDIKFKNTDHATHESINDTLKTQFNDFHYWLSEETAVERLQRLLLSTQTTFRINDEATRQYFESSLVSPQLLGLTNNSNPDIEIQCTGLEPYWSNQDGESLKLVTVVTDHKRNTSCRFLDTIRNPTREPLLIASEIIANHVVKYLGKLHATEVI